MKNISPNLSVWLSASLQPNGCGFASCSSYLNFRYCTSLEKSVKFNGKMHVRVLNTLHGYFNKSITACFQRKMYFLRELLVGCSHRYLDFQEKKPTPQRCIPVLLLQIFLEIYYSFTKIFNVGVILFLLLS